MTTALDLGLIPEADVAEMLGLTILQLRRKIKGAGKGPNMTQIGRARYYTREDLDAWLASCRVPGEKKRKAKTTTTEESVAEA